MIKYTITNDYLVKDMKTRSIYKTNTIIQKRVNDFLEYISINPFQILQSNGEYKYRIDIPIGDKKYLLAACYTLNEADKKITINKYVFYEL